MGVYNTSRFYIYKVRILEVDSWFPNVFSCFTVILQMKHTTRMRFMSKSLVTFEKSNKWKTN